MSSNGRASLCLGSKQDAKGIIPNNAPNTACSVHPNPEKHRGHGGGSLRVFRHFARLRVDSVKVVFSRPTHQYPAGA